MLGCIKEMKKSLRSQKCQLAAEHMRTLLKDISDASTDNKKLFYTLVRKQRSSSREICSSVEFGLEITDQLEGWASYFERLATAENPPHFNEAHKSMELKKAAS